jgi:hypothetical protein
MEFVKEVKGFYSYTGFATKTVMKREMQKGIRIQKMIFMVTAG